MVTRYPYRENADKILKELCVKGIESRYSKDIRKSAEEKIAKELEIIKAQGSASAYIIFKEMLDATEVRPNDFVIRGTVASTVVAYVLGFSDIDPINSDPALYDDFYYGLDGKRGVSFELYAPEPVCKKINRYFKNYPGDEKVKRKKCYDIPDWWFIGEYDEKDPFGTFYINVIPESEVKVIPALISGDVYNICRPKTMTEYVKCYGFTHSTGAWEDNAENLLTNGEVPFEDLIGNREDVYEFLLRRGINNEMAFEITEYVRKGRAYGMKWKPDMKSAMTDANVPEWFIGSCEKIRYLFPRAHAILYVKKFMKDIEKWYLTGTLNDSSEIVYNADYLTRVLSDIEVLKPGNLVMIGGRPSMGKTSLALSIVDSLSIINDKTCVYFSTGMYKESLVRRLLDIHIFLSGNMSKDWKKYIGKLSDMCADAQKAHLYIDFDIQNGIEEAIVKCREIGKKEHIDLVVLDYLQLMTEYSPDGLSEELTRDILTRLKDLAVELGCTVMVLSQLNRTVENRKDKHPKVSDFIGIKKPLDIADYAMMLYRDAYYDKECDRSLAEIKVVGRKTEQDLFVRFDGYRFYMQ